MSWKATWFMNNGWIESDMKIAKRAAEEMCRLLGIEEKDILVTLVDYIDRQGRHQDGRGQPQIMVEDQTHHITISKQGLHVSYALIGKGGDGQVVFRRTTSRGDNVIIRVVRGLATQHGRYHNFTKAKISNLLVNAVATILPSIYPQKWEVLRHGMEQGTVTFIEWVWE